MYRRAQLRNAPAARICTPPNLNTPALAARRTCAAPIEPRSCWIALCRWVLRVGGLGRIAWVVLGLGCFLAAGNAQTLYWDINGSTAGAGGATPSGNWNTTGATNWSSVAAGTGSTANWTSGADAVFSAGTDATGSYTVTLGASMNVGNLTVEDGTLGITANTLNFTRVGGSTINVASGLTTTVSSILGGSVAIIKDGNGTFVTGGASGNTATGSVTIKNGVFEIAKTAYVGGIDNAAAVSVDATGTLRLNGGTLYTQETIGSLAGSGTVTNVGLAAVNLVIGGGTSTTFSGTITNGTNALNLVKNGGTGTFTVSGANSYTGVTTVSTGTLNVQNSRPSAPRPAGPRWRRARLWNCRAASRSAPKRCRSAALA